MIHRNPHSERVQVGIECPQAEGRTKQSFKEECDINYIMRNWLRTGEDPRLPPHQSHYGDFTNVVTFQGAFEQIMRANQAFQSLPLAVRQRFNHRPQELLDFIDDPNNHDEAVQLQILRSPSQDAAHIAAELGKTAEHQAELELKKKQELLAAEKPTGAPAPPSNQPPAAQQAPPANDT